MVRRRGRKKSYFSHEVLSTESVVEDQEPKNLEPSEPAVEPGTIEPPEEAGGERQEAIEPRTIEPAEPVNIIDKPSEPTPVPMPVPAEQPALPPGSEQPVVQTVEEPQPQFEQTTDEQINPDRQ